MNSAPRVRYDYNWEFRRDWVRNGIPWFILPADQILAGTRKYNQSKLQYVRKRLSGTSKTDYLQDVLDHVLHRQSSDQNKVEAIIRFVQDATWHNPLECPFEADEKTIVTGAHELLELHDARCWHTAEILRQLFLEAGWNAKITRLPSPTATSTHVITEVFYDDEWHYADANYFKNHVVLRKPDGSLPTLKWLQEHPHYADHLPGGWIFPPEYLTNAAGLNVAGQFTLPFPEAENTWGSDGYYCYYLGADEKFPPITPPGLRVEFVAGDAAKLSWRPSVSRTSQFILYDVQVRRSADAAVVFSVSGLETTHVVIESLEPQEIYLAALRATDEHLLVEPHTWYPATTLSFRQGKDQSGKVTSPVTSLRIPHVQ